MNWQQVILELVLALALTSCVCALTPRHVLGVRGDRGGDGKKGKDSELKTFPETPFEFGKPDKAEYYRKKFIEVSNEPEFMKMYPCKYPQSAELISFRFTMRPGIWTRIVYRVVIELPNDMEDMIFVEILDVLGYRAKPLLMAIRNRVSSSEPLPERVDHFINDCPAPYSPIRSGSGWTDK